MLLPMAATAAYARSAGEGWTPILSLAGLTEAAGIEGVVLRTQQTPRHDLVETVVHKQHLAELKTLLERMAPDEIATVLEIPEGTSKTWLFEAKKELKKKKDTVPKKKKKLRTRKWKRKALSILVMQPIKPRSSLLA